MAHHLGYYARCESRPSHNLNLFLDEQAASFLHPRACELDALEWVLRLLQIPVQRRAESLAAKYRQIELPRPRPRRGQVAGSLLRRVRDDNKSPAGNISRGWRDILA